MWGVTIGASILQNELTRKLPPAFVAQLPQGVQVAYTAIPGIKDLPAELQESVRQAFAESVRVVWIVLLSIAAATGVTLL